MSKQEVNTEVRTKLCGACGVEIYPVTRESKRHFEARETCNRKPCRDLFAEGGRRFSRYRESAFTPELVLDSRQTELLLARRFPSFLLQQPVEKAVENLLSI